MRRRERVSARRDKTPKRGVSDRTLIRELFIQRVPLYSFADAVRLTRTAQAEVEAAITTGDISTETFSGRLVIAWDDVAKLALDRWTPRMISGALGSVDRRSVVPLLNRIQQIEVFLPVYQIRLLHYLAGMERGQFRARLNASDVLERYLLDLASAVNADELELAIPGFRAALHYPYFIPREDDWSTAFCWYCGRVSDVPGRQVCTDCHGRHEPRPHLGEDGIPELRRSEVLFFGPCKTRKGVDSMHDGVTRRGVLQLFAAMTAAVPVLPRDTSAPVLPAADAPPSETPAAQRVVGPSRPTPLESYLRSRGVRPAHLARECGYEPAHLLRIRMGRIEPTPACAVGIVYGLRRLLREPVALTDMFPRATAEAAWRERRAIVREYHPFEHRAVRAVFRQGGRRG